MNWLLFLLACGGLDQRIESKCHVHRAWYPDTDGDGLGEVTDVFVGCEGPDGWVTRRDTSATLHDSATGQARDTGADTGEAAR